MNHIRIATKQDIPKLIVLLAELFRLEATQAFDHERQREGLLQLVSDNTKGKILVAFRQHEPVGMVNLQYNISTALGRRVAVLEDMIVTEPARNSGIGSELLSAALEACRTDGCARVTLQARQENVAAQRFYRRFGFQALPMISYSLPLFDN